MAVPSTSHAWRFFRSGGFDQVLIEKAVDLQNLSSLDAKLWASLSCPTHNLEMDATTLEMVDSDKDGRIRLPEITAAVAWACSMLREPSLLLTPGSELPLAAIDESKPEGRLLQASARRILINRGKQDQDTIDIGDVLDTQAIFSQTRFNGDGIVPAVSADDAETQAVITDIIHCLGGETDRSGQPGINSEKSKRFFDELEATVAWLAKAAAESKAILPLGDATATAHGACQTVAAKIDDYFSRCRLADFDPRAANHLNCSEEQLGAIGSTMLSANAQETRDLPLAHIEAGRALPLEQGLNPAWAADMDNFRRLVVEPLLGSKHSELSADDWLILRGKLAPFAAWQAAKPTTSVEALGHGRMQAILASDSQATIESLISQDLAQQEEAKAIASVEKLLRYRRDLVTLLRNFVNFADFYSRDLTAIFQAGTLYLDSRGCDLCIRVDDMGKHAALAQLSRIYLAYCECRRQGSSEKMVIAAAFTAGDSDNLMVGRNGVFYDRQGRDWDATIVKIIEHPISVAQAFWSPYKRIGRMIGEQIEKMATARDKEMQAKAATNIADTGKKVEAPGPDAPKPAFDVGKFAGIFAAIGLAVGAIGTAIAAIVTGFLSLEWWQMPLALIGVMLAISLPSMVIASLKLRQRNLAPLLDANGWAVNTQARINISFGRSLTHVASLPAGAQRRLDDPFADKKSRWPWLLLFIAAGAAATAWWMGWLVL